MAQQTYNILVSFRAGATADQARSETTLLSGFLQPYNGAITPSKTPGEVTIRVQLDADDSVAAASGGAALLQAAFEQAGTGPPLGPVTVKVTVAVS